MAEAPPTLNPREFEQKLRLARNAVGSLERAMRTRKLYTVDHPLREEATTDILARFREFFDRYGYLRLEITDREIRLDGAAVLTAEPRDSEIPFRLYKDGLRELRFSRGITAEDVLGFLSVLELDSRQKMDMDEDIVSLLWSKDLTTIDFTAVDEFEAEDGGTASADPELRRVAKDVGDGIERVMGSVGGGRGGAADPAAPAAPVASSAPAPKDPDGPPLSDDEIEAIFSASLTPVIQSLREEIQNETLGGAIRRSLDIILRIFSESGKVTAAEVGPLLRGVTSFYAKKGDVADIGHLLTKLKESGFLDTIEGGAALWKELGEELRVPDAAIQLPAFLNHEFDGDFEGLKRYFDLVGPALVPQVCAAYANVAAQRTRLALREYLVEHGRTAPAAFKTLLSTSEKLLGETLEIVRLVKPQGIALDEALALEKLPGPVKMQVIAVAASIDGGARTRILKRALADAEPAMRSHALRTIAQGHDAFLATLMREWIADKSFAARDAEEKVLAFRALVKTAGSGTLTQLRETTERKPGMFDRQRGNETRRAAVLAIRDVATPDAHALLTKLAEGADEQLRGYAEEAMKR